MDSLRYPCRLACLFLCSVAIFLSPTHAKESVILNALPANTCGWVHIHNFEAWHKAFDESKLRDLLNTPAFRDFSQAWDAHTESDAFALEFGLTTGEFKELAKGDFVMAWLPAGPNRLTTIAVIDTTTTNEAVKTSLATAAERYIKNGYQQKSVDTGGGEIQRFTSGEMKAVIGHNNNRLVIGHDEGAVRATLNAGQSSGARLSDDPGFQYLKDRLADVNQKTADSRTDWYCAPWRLLKYAPAPPNNLSLLIEQGFGAVDGIGGSMVFDSENLLTYQAVVHIQQPLRDSAVSLRAKPVTTELPEWIVARTRGVQVIGIDADAILSGYGKWFDATEGEGEEGIFELVLEEIRDEPDAPGVDIKAELVDQIASPLYVLRPRLGTKDAVDELAMVTAIKAKQPAVVRQAVARMLEGDPDIKKITIGNETAWQFGDLTQDGTRQVLGPDLSEVTVCMFNEYLLVSADSNAIATIVSESPANEDHLKTLDALKSLIAKRAEATPNGSLVGYRFAHGADWMAQGYDRLRSAEAIERPEGAAVTMGNMTITLFNRMMAGSAQSAFSQLPPRNVAKQHLGVAMDVAHASNQDGWLVSGLVQPAPAKDTDGAE